MSQRLLSPPGSYVFATVSRHMLEVTNDGPALVYEGCDGSDWIRDRGGMLDWTGYCCCSMALCKGGKSWEPTLVGVYSGGEGSDG